MGSGVVSEGEGDATIGATEHCGGDTDAPLTNGYEIDIAALCERVRSYRLDEQVPPAQVFRIREES